MSDQMEFSHGPLDGVKVPWDAEHPSQIIVLIPAFDGRQTTNEYIAHNYLSLHSFGVDANGHPDEDGEFSLIQMFHMAAARKKLQEIRDFVAD